MKLNEFIIICPLLISEGRVSKFSNRCFSLCSCLYSTSCFRLRHTKQRDDSIYWIHKNNNAVTNGGMNNSTTRPEERISLMLLRKPMKRQKRSLSLSVFFLFFLVLPALIITLQVGWHLKLGSAHCRQYLVFLTAVISSQGRGEVIKSNSLQLKLCWVDKYELLLLKRN